MGSRGECASIWDIMDRCRGRERNARARGCTRNCLSSGVSHIQATASRRNAIPVSYSQHVAYRSRRGGREQRASPHALVLPKQLLKPGPRFGSGSMRACALRMEDDYEGKLASSITIRHRTVEANGITMHVAEAGPEAGKVVLFLHGFAELWYSWRHQMCHLAARGYRCVAPDLRGYGDTDMPTNVGCYTAFHLVGDVIGLLDALGIHKVFVVGHDWGALISWYLCLFRPDRVTALVNTSVAFVRHVMICTGAAAIKPTEHFNRAYGPSYYICRFQEPGLAEKTLAAAHARQHVLGNLCGNRFRDDVANEELELPPWLTENDIDYFVMAFEKTGFTGGINYYRNMDRNWELAAPWADAKVRVPTKFIVGDEDFVYHSAGIQEYIHAGGFKEDVPLLEEVVIIKGAGHFIQQQKAHEVSDHIYSFIAKF